MYDKLGKAAIRFAFRYLRRRYRREIRIGARRRRGRVGDRRLPRQPQRPRGLSAPATHIYACGGNLMQIDVRGGAERPR